MTEKKTAARESKFKNIKISWKTQNVEENGSRLLIFSQIFGTQSAPRNLSQ